MLRWSRNDQYRRHAPAPPEATSSSQPSHSSRTASNPQESGVRRQRRRRTKKLSTTTEEDVSHDSSNVVTDVHKLDYIRNIIAREGTPFWPYASGAGGYPFGLGAQFDPRGGNATPSGGTGGFSARTSSDADTLRYADEDLSRNTAGDWEDSEMARKTNSNAETLAESLPESAPDSVAASMTDSNTGSDHGDSRKRLPEAGGKYSYAAVFVFLGGTFAVAAAFGLAAFFYSSGELAQKSSTEGNDLGAFEGEPNNPVVFHAAGNVQARSRRSTPGEAPVPVAARRSVFVNSDNRGSGLEDNLQQPVVSDEEQSQPTTEKPRRRKKIAVWEGKRIYNAGGTEATSTTKTAPSSTSHGMRVTNTAPPSTKRFQIHATSNGGDADRATTSRKKYTHRTTARRVAVPAVKRRSRTPVTLSGHNTRFCETRVCERESVYLTSYLDWGVSPCDDFYSFVCNRWKNLHPEVATSVDSLLVQKVEEDIYHALTSQTRPSNKVIKAQSLIGACVHKPFTEDHRTALVDFMGELGLRGWPFQRDTKTLTDVWKSASLLLRNLGLAVLVSVKVEPDPENEERYVISLGDPDLLIGQYGSQESALPDWYAMAVTSCFKVFTSGKYVDIARRVREFSARLAEASTDRGSEVFAASRFKMVQLKHHPNLIQLLTFTFSNITVVHSRMKVLVKTEQYFRDLRTVLHVSKGVDDAQLPGLPRPAAHLAAAARPGARDGLAADEADHRDDAA
ncbi:hypothetical protein V5799_031402 [Amblyomma americanum]|uniref:Peptidase M13 N-terminal domain-containing protein n=1 Tax=Amblyomma americanum TaxID=6943 RepID=A0AAQ4EKJ2_AMBAM